MVIGKLTRKLNRTDCALLSRYQIPFNLLGMYLYEDADYNNPVLSELLSNTLAEVSGDSSGMWLPWRVYFDNLLPSVYWRGNLSVVRAPDKETAEIFLLEFGRFIYDPFLTLEENYAAGKAK